MTAEQEFRELLSQWGVSSAGFLTDFADAGLVVVLADDLDALVAKASADIQTELNVAVAERVREAQERCAFAGCPNYKFAHPLRSGGNIQLMTDPYADPPAPHGDDVPPQDSYEEEAR